MLLFLLAKQPPDFWTSFWSNPATSSIATIVGSLIGAIIGVAATVWVFHRQQRQARQEKITKQLAYKVISDAPIANVNKEVKDRVKIFFDDTETQDLHLIILQLRNSGNVAIKPEDYNDPIEITFSNGEIKSSEILSTDPPDLIAPKDLKLFLTSSANSIIFSKSLLLNPKELLRMKVLVTGAQSKISVRARIADGTTISEYELLYQVKQVELRAFNRRLRITWTLTLVSMALTILLPLLLLINHENTMSPLFIILALIALIAFLITPLSAFAFLKERIYGHTSN